MSEPVVARWSSLSDERARSTGRALLFQLNGATYAISVDFIDKVIELAEVTPVPRCNPWTVGVVVHDSLPYTLVDPRFFLQPETVVSSAALQRAILIKSAHGNVLIGVEQLVTISELADRARVEGRRPEFPPALIDYVCRSETSLVGVLSIPRLLRAAGQAQEPVTMGHDS